MSYPDNSHTLYMIIDMYIFLVDKRAKPTDQFKEWLGEHRALCHVLEKDLSDKDEVQNIINRYKKISCGRPLYAVFQPKAEYVHRKNKIQYTGSFKGIESMMITEAQGLLAENAIKTKDIIAHIKYYSKIKSVKRGYNISDIVKFIKEDVPAGSMVVIIGIRNINTISRAL